MIAQAFRPLVGGLPPWASRILDSIAWSSDGSVVDLLVEFGIRCQAERLPVSRDILRHIAKNCGGQFGDLDDCLDTAIKELRLIETHEMTDVGNAERFAREHHGHVLHCGKFGRWFIWDEKRWAQDDTGRVVELAKDTVRGIHREAFESSDEARRKALASHANRSQSASRIQGLVTLAKSIPTLAVSPADFERDPWLLNVLNGTIELQTATIRPPSPRDRIRKVASAAFDPNAAAPLWERFLERIFPDADLRAFVQRAVGYSLTGDTTEQCLFLLHGNGANGKSTFLEVIRRVLGDYALQSQADTFMVTDRRSSAASPELARLNGARFVSASELEQGQRLSEVLVKQMTGGEPMVARFLYGDPVEFRPAFKVWLAVNHKPEIRGTEEAIWRRIKPIPFAVTIPQDERDPNLVDRLMEEAPGILSWGVEGCVRWRAERLGAPSAVLEDAKAYRQEMDRLADFLEDECVIGADCRVRVADLYQAYVRHCEQNHDRPLGKKQFNVRLVERGCQAPARGTHGQRTWRGLGLRANSEVTK